jgi:DNA polymerase III sliding clamp (beta) subunit (PCNA family)
MEINFNQNYLIDALKACDDDYVVLRLANRGKGMVIIPRDEDVKEDASYLQLVMPVRSR